MQRIGRGLATLAALTLPATALAATSGSDAQKLPEVVVTATRTPADPQTLGSSVSVITAQRLKKLQITRVAQALRLVPGVSVDHAGNPGNRTDVRIRGSEANHVLVMIDGVKVNNPRADDQVDLGNLLVGDIQRIEVLRGPQSVLYGSEAVGGVINIITKKGKRGVHGSAKVEGGSFNTRHGTATLSGGDKSGDFSVSADGYSTDGISYLDDDKGGHEKDGSRSKTFSGRGRLHVTDDFELSSVVRYTDSRVETDSGNTDTNDAILGTDWLARLQGKLYSLGGRLEQTLGVEQNHSNYENQGSNPFKSEGRRQGVDYQANYYFDESDIFTAGASWNKGTAESTYVSGFSHETRSVFGQYQSEPVNNLYLTGGLRYDDDTDFGDFTTYRVTAAYLLPRTGTRFHSSLGTAFKLPTFTDQAYGGNPDLKPENSLGWDAGVKQTFWRNRIKLNVTYFENHVHDLIEFVTFNRAENVGEARTRGVETAVDVDLTHGWNVKASYTWMQPKNRDTGQDLLRRPRHEAELTVDAPLWHHASAFVTAHYKGQRYDQYYNPATYQSERKQLPAYTVVDVGAQHRFNNHWRVFGRIENLLDRDYEDQYNVGSPGRAYYVGAEAQY